MLGSVSLLAALGRSGCQAGIPKATFSFSRLASTFATSRPSAHRKFLQANSSALRGLTCASNVCVKTNDRRLLQCLRKYTTARSLAGLGSRSLQPRFFSANSTFQAAAAETVVDLPVLTPPSVGYWLLGTTFLIYAVIVVGGVTRLTESGLSITEWKPVSGIVPPLTQRDWEEEFEKYKATPEFKL